MTTATTRVPARPYGGISAQQRVAERRARFIEAALEQFGTRGVLRTGVKDLCREAGLTDRYFYESFRDSGELFTAVFDRVTAQLFEVVVTALGAAPPQPDAQARAVIEAYVRALADDPRLARIVFVEAASAGPQVEAHMRETLRRFAELVAATARPHLPAQMPDEQVRFGALAIVGAIERLMIEWQDGELGLSIDQIVDYLSTMIIAALSVAEVSARRESRAKPRSTRSGSAR